MGSPPRPPFLLATNHLSYLDILVLASRLPVHFVAKVEVRRWPVLGPLCKGFGTLFIDRSDRRDIPRVLAEIEAALARGEGVIVFPEGTELLRRDGPAVPVAPPGAAGPEGFPGPRRHPGLPPAGGLLVGGTPLGSHLLSLFRLPRIEATIDFAPEPVIEADRKRLAERLREAVLERLETRK